MVQVVNLTPAHLFSGLSSEGAPISNGAALSASTSSSNGAAPSGSTSSQTGSDHRASMEKAMKLIDGAVKEAERTNAIDKPEWLAIQEKAQKIQLKFDELDQLANDPQSFNESEFVTKARVTQYVELFELLDQVQNLSSHRGENGADKAQLIKDIKKHLLLGGIAKLFAFLLITKLIPACFPWFERLYGEIAELRQSLKSLSRPLSKEEGSLNSLYKKLKSAQQGFAIWSAVAPLRRKNEELSARLDEVYGLTRTDQLIGPIKELTNAVNQLASIISGLREGLNIPNNEQQEVLGDCRRLVETLQGEMQTQQNAQNQTAIALDMLKEELRNNAQELQESGVEREQEALTPMPTQIDRFSELESNTQERQESEAEREQEVRTLIDRLSALENNTQERQESEAEREREIRTLIDRLSALESNTQQRQENQTDMRWRRKQIERHENQLRKVEKKVKKEITHQHNLEMDAFREEFRNKIQQLQTNDRGRLEEARALIGWNENKFSTLENSTKQLRKNQIEMQRRTRELIERHGNQLRKVENEVKKEVKKEIKKEVKQQHSLEVGALRKALRNETQQRQTNEGERLQAALVLIDRYETRFSQLENRIKQLEESQIKMQRLHKEQVKQYENELDKLKNKVLQLVAKSTSLEGEVGMLRDMFDMFTDKIGKLSFGLDDQLEVLVELHEQQVDLASAVGGSRRGSRDRIQITMPKKSTERHEREEGGLKLIKFGDWVGESSSPILPVEELDERANISGISDASTLLDGSSPPTPEPAEKTTEQEGSSTQSTNPGRWSQLFNFKKESSAVSDTAVVEASAESAAALIGPELGEEKEEGDENQFVEISLDDEPVVNQLEVKSEPSVKQSEAKSESSYWPVVTLPSALNPFSRSQSPLPEASKQKAPAEPVNKPENFSSLTEKAKQEEARHQKRRLSKRHSEISANRERPADIRRHRSSLNENALRAWRERESNAAGPSITNLG